MTNEYFARCENLEEYLDGIAWVDLINKSVKDEWRKYAEWCVARKQMFLTQKGFTRHATNKFTLKVDVKNGKNRIFIAER